MYGFKDNIEQLTITNTYFRKVLYTGKYSQLVLMSLKPQEEIGLETHSKNDQFFRFEKGNGKVTIDSTVYDICDGDAVLVPAGAQHNVVNTSQTDLLQFYTLYAPAHHKDKIERKTKKEAMENEAEFEGRTTE